MQVETVVAACAAPLARHEASRPSPAATPILSLRHYITETDWDRKVLGIEPWINGLCWGVIALSLLYFSATALPILGR